MARNDDGERQSNNVKIAILLIAPVLAAIALLALRPKEDVQQPAPDPKPAPVVDKQPEPPPQPEQLAVADTAQQDAARDALLGLNKPQPELKQKPAPVKRLRAAARRVREETEETEDDYVPPTQESDGGLSDAKFRETIEAWRGMRTCVESSKTRMSRTTGALRMSLKITGSGDVLGGRVYDESNDAARKVARCVEKRMASLKFPAFETREPAIVKEAKFVF